MKILKQVGKYLLVSKLALAAVLVVFVVPLAAFEAHVINVTAVIERPPMQCDALSIGYWRNHEGCDQGEGESVWPDEIHEMTTNFSGLFYGITGEEICQDLWIPNCPSGNNAPAKRCRATAMALADELNLVSGRLALDALIAGADDGNSAFDNLGLDYNSTVEEALTGIEYIVSNPNYSASQYNDAAYVAERIYSFYEDENTDAPYCVIDPVSLSSSIVPRISSPSQDAPEEDEEENEEEAPEENDENNHARGRDSANENSGGDNKDNNDENNLGEQNENATTSEDVIMNEQSQIENATSSEEMTTDEQPPDELNSDNGDDQTIFAPEARTTSPASEQTSHADAI